jgi:hypothetical protein
MHNVPNHQVMRVLCPHDESVEVGAIIEAANQFVVDNYDADDQAFYIASTIGGEIIFPIQMSIVGNFLVFAEATKRTLKIAGFLADLRRKLLDNGLRLEDCIGYGSDSLHSSRNRLIEAKPI